MMHFRNFILAERVRYSVFSSLRQCFSNATSIRTGADELASCSILLSAYSLSLAALKHLVSISAMSACPCLRSPICLWILRFRSNFFRPDPQNERDFGEPYAIARYICTESSFWWVQIKTRGTRSWRSRLTTPTMLSHFERNFGVNRASRSQIAIDETSPFHSSISCR